MGKKNDDYDDLIGSIKKEKLKQMADQIDNFIKFVDKFLFIEGITDEEYQRIIKHAKKASKRLRKGKDLDKVLDLEKIEECIQEDSSFAAEYLDMD